MNEEVARVYFEWLRGDFTVEGQQRIFEKLRQSRCFHWNFDEATERCLGCGVRKQTLLMQQSLRHPKTPL